MPQSELAKYLRVDDQAVARWEKKKCKLPGPADFALRVLFLTADVAQPEGKEILGHFHKTIESIIEQDAPLYTANHSYCLWRLRHNTGAAI